MRTQSLLVSLLAGSLAAVAPSFAQSPSAGGAPTSGDFGAERRWVMEHPEG